MTLHFIARPLNNPWPFDNDCTVSIAFELVCFRTSTIDDNFRCGHDRSLVCEPLAVPDSCDQDELHALTQIRREDSDPLSDSVVRLDRSRFSIRRDFIGPVH